MFINIVLFTNRAVIDNLKNEHQILTYFLVYFDKTIEQIDNKFYNCDVKTKKKLQLCVKIYVCKSTSYVNNTLQYTLLVH